MTLFCWNAQPSNTRKSKNTYKTPRDSDGTLEIPEKKDQATTMTDPISLFYPVHDCLLNAEILIQFETDDWYHRVRGELLQGWKPLWEEACQNTLSCSSQQTEPRSCLAPDGRITRFQK